MRNILQHNEVLWCWVINAPTFPEYVRVSGAAGSGFTEEATRCPLCAWIITDADIGTLGWDNMLHEPTGQIARKPVPEAP